MAIWKNDGTNNWYWEVLSQPETSKSLKVNESSLELTLHDPSVSDAGFYRCKTRFNITRIEDQKAFLPVSW